MGWISGSLRNMELQKCVEGGITCNDSRDYEHLLFTISRVTVVRIFSVWNGRENVEYLRTVTQE